jgi:hypothetical protein
MALINAFRPNHIGRVTRAVLIHREGVVEFTFSIFENESTTRPIQTLHYRVEDERQKMQRLHFIDVINFANISPTEGMCIHTSYEFEDDPSTYPRRSEPSFKNCCLKYENGSWHRITPISSNFYIVDKGVYEYDGLNFNKTAEYSSLLNYERFFGLATLDAQGNNLVRSIYSYLKTLPEWSLARDYL